MLAADMGSGQAQLVTQEIGQQHANADAALDPLVVDGERDVDLRIAGILRDGRSDFSILHRATLSRARAAAFATIRRSKAATARRR